MDLGFKGKTVVITGGTKGIGSGISEVFAMEGANLIIDYRSNKDNSSEAFIQGLREKYNVKAFGIMQDLADPNCAKNIFDFALEIGEDAWHGVSSLKAEDANIGFFKSEYAGWFDRAICWLKKKLFVENA